MIIIGASGHAKDVLIVLEETSKNGDLIFFDDVTQPKQDLFLDKYSVLHSLEDIDFTSKPSFITALSNPKSRRFIAQRFIKLGGVYESIISKTAILGNHKINIEKGVTVLSKAYISNSVSIGEGTLINVSTQIHHDVSIGEYCDISPGAILLGYVKIGNNCSIGSGAIICPRVTIGDNIIIGAGAVVVNDYLEENTIVGVPARPIKPKA